MFSSQDVPLNMLCCLQMAVKGIVYVSALSVTITT